MKFSRHSLVAILLLATSLLSVYFMTARFGLVNIDDYEYLVRSKAVVGGVSLSGLAWSWQSLEHGIVMPLTWLSYMLDFSLFGEEPWGAMHLHCVVLHMVNAALVFMLLSFLLRQTAGGSDARRTGIALLAAAFWALHPLRVESVAWLSSRKDVLSFMFEMGACLCWCQAVCRKSVDGKFCAAYLLSLLLFGLGALAKPSVMTYPLLQACIDVFLLRRFRPRMYVIPLPMMLGIGMEAAYAQAAGGATGNLAAVPVCFRLLNAMSAFGIYLCNTVFPNGLAPQCMHRYPALPRAVATGVVLSLAACGFLIWRGRQVWKRRGELFVRDDDSGLWAYRGSVDWLLVGLLWFCIGIGPFLGIANFGYHAFADRFTYIPAVGLSLIALGIVRDAGAAARLLLFAGVVALAGIAFRQVTFWRDDATMWRQTLAVDGDGNAVAHGGLGMEAFEFRHDLETACREFERMRDINESAYWGVAQVHVYALCEMGRLGEAEDVLTRYCREIANFRHQNRTVEHTPLGDVDVTPNISNVEHAEIAVALCVPNRREEAWREIQTRAVREGMSRSLAYLAYRYAVLTGNKKLAANALETLAKTEKTDYLQFRHLTK